MGNISDSGNDGCHEARENVSTRVKPDCRFPRNIFAGDWSDFSFFDSDWMTQPDFVDHVKAFLDVDGAQCACLWNLDSEVPNEPRFFFVRQQTTSKEYRAPLRGKTPGYGWLDAMERIACASASSAWCMYCEPNNDISYGFSERALSPEWRDVFLAEYSVPSS
jgi:hypothetical protein